MVWPVTITIIVVFLMLAAVVSSVIAKKQEQRSRYLSVIARAHATHGNESSTDKNLVKQRDDIAKKLKQASKETQEKKKDKTSIRQMLQMAGIDAPASKYWIVSAIFASFVWSVLLLTNWLMAAKILVVFTAFLGVPKLFLKWKIARRQKKFIEDFADALDGMVRLLQAGMPMAEAIAMGSREFSGPIKEELLRVHDHQKIGIPLGEAALMMAQRIPLPEVHMFAAALQIQSETGSSLSEVLSNLSNVIRSRFRLRRKVKALSSEAMSSAAIIGALPLVVTFGLYCVRPEYVGILFTLPKGKLMLIGAGTWMSFGMMLMRQMINFRI